MVRDIRVSKSLWGVSPGDSEQLFSHGIMSKRPPPTAMTGITSSFIILADYPF